MSAFRSFVNVVGRTGRAYVYIYIYYIYFYIYTQTGSYCINEYISGLVCNLIMKFRLSAPANMAATRVFIFALLRCYRETMRFVRSATFIRRVRLYVSYSYTRRRTLYFHILFYISAHDET